MYKVLGPIALTLLAACSAAPSGGGSSDPTNTGEEGSGSTGAGNSGSGNSGSSTSGSSGSSTSGNSGSSTSGNSGSSSGSHSGSSSGSTGSGNTGSGNTGSGSSSGGSTTSGGGSSGAGSKGGSGSSSGGSASAPTWTDIYTKYMATGTIGHCASCHSQQSTASGAYAFLSGYIDGTSSTLDTLFSWMGGYMPPGGPTSNTQATNDVDAWVAAGALNN